MDIELHRQLKETVYLALIPKTSNACYLLNPQVVTTKWRLFSANIRHILVAILPCMSLTAPPTEMRIMATNFVAVRKD